MPDTWEWVWTSACFGGDGGGPVAAAAERALGVALVVRRGGAAPCSPNLAEGVGSCCADALAAWRSMPEGLPRVDELLPEVSGGDPQSAARPDRERGRSGEAAGPARRERPPPRSILPARSRDRAGRRHSAAGRRRPRGAARPPPGAGAPARHRPRCRPLHPFGRRRPCRRARERLRRGSLAAARRLDGGARERPRICSSPNSGCAGGPAPPGACRGRARRGSSGLASACARPQTPGTGRSIARWYRSISIGGSST